MTKLDFPIIGIGASAGGLEPLEVLFDHVDNTSGYAYVVVQHLAPNHKSLMDELLSRHTALPIKVIEEGMTIKPNHIYLNPPKKFVHLKNGRFSLSDKEDKKLSYPITTFFNSLAEVQHEKAAAVVLSGTGSDGAEGIKFIKEKGGLVLVQDPVTAKFDGMPKMAIQSGSADIVCRIERIPAELEKFFWSNQLIQPEQLQSVEYKEQITRIIELVKSQTGIDFSGYKFSTVYRRTVRRMGIMGYNDLTEYYQYMKSSTNESQLLGKELLIGVTRFFRDQDVFDAVKNQVIPELVKKTLDSRSLRIWVPACSTGEEAYSLAILIKEHLRSEQLQFDVTIFATDLDKEAIETAANRIFPSSIANEVPTHLLSSYFIPQNKGFRIAKEIREMIVFSAHNIIQDPPFSKIDLLSCRNFLIYLNPDVQQRLYALFQYTLKPDGFLLLGASESLGEMADQFEEFDKKHKIFTNINKRKVLQQRLRDPISKPAQASTRITASNYSDRFASRSPMRTLSEIQNFLIREYVPDTLIFSDDFELMHTTGRTNEWLRLPKGEISTNVVKMLPGNIGLAFEVAAGKVVHTGEPVSVRNVQMTPEMQSLYNGTHLHVHIKKLRTDFDYMLFAATFEVVAQETPSENSTDIDMRMASKEKVGILERELRVNRENLQSTIEELESSNEELQAANEELQSSNEELESVNEELYTVNAEYQQKAEELAASNNDLNNLIQSTRIAILFLDVDLTIRRFTPAIKSILNLMPQDIGRHISHFRTRFQLDDFMERIEAVHETLQPFETTISDLSEHQYMMRVTPFKTGKHEIRGVVLSFVDITAISAARNALELSESALNEMTTRSDEKAELFELIANNATDMISLHALDSTIEYVSPSSQEIFGYTSSELEGKKPEQFIEEEKYHALWNDNLSKIKTGQNTGVINYPARKKDGSLRWFETRFRSITNQQGKLSRFLATTKDVSQRMKYEEELRRLSLIAKQTNNAIIITDTQGRINFVNDAFEEMTGYVESEILGKIPGHFLQGEESDEETVKVMRDAIKGRKAFDVEILNYSKSGHKYWTRIQCEPMYGPNNEHTGFFSLQNDISQEREYKSYIDSLNMQLQLQNSKLAEMNKSLEEFAYVASHDLKAPARNIIGILQLMDKKNIQPNDPEYKEYSGMIVSAAKEMNRLIESLLEYSRTGNLNESLTTFSLQDMVVEIECTFSQQLEATHGKLVFSCDKDVIVGYPILFKRLLQNLVSNALKYRSEKPPEIKINCTSGNNETTISVADNGIGIDYNQHENIFKIFNTLQPSPDSNGIGLAVCKKIVEQHNGKMWVESEPGKGSCFYITIPQ